MDCIKGPATTLYLWIQLLGKIKMEIIIWALKMAEMKRRLVENGNADDGTMFIAQHFSHNCGYIYDETVDLLKPSGFITAYDGMEVVIKN